MLELVLSSGRCMYWKMTVCKLSVLCCVFVSAETRNSVTDRRDCCLRIDFTSVSELLFRHKCITVIRNGYLLKIAFLKKTFCNSDNDIGRIARRRVC